MSFLWSGAEEYDVNDLPDIPENKWKKKIALRFELKYLKSNQSGHNNDGHNYFKQVDIIYNISV